MTSKSKSANIDLLSGWRAPAPRRSVEAKRDHGGVERRVGELLEPVADVGGQDLRQDEVPEEHLHEERDVAEELDIGLAEPRQPEKRGGAGDADERPEHERDRPSAERGEERPAGAHQERLEIGVHPVRRRLEEYAPVPVIVHACRPLRLRTAGDAPLQRQREEKSMQGAGLKPARETGPGFSLRGRGALVSWNRSSYAAGVAA